MSARWFSGGLRTALVAPSLFLPLSRIWLSDLAFDAARGGGVVALKSRIWGGGMWAVVEARRMSPLGCRSAWGRWIASHWSFPGVFSSFVGPLSLVLLFYMRGVSLNHLPSVVVDRFGFYFSDLVLVVVGGSLCRRGGFFACRT